MSTSTYTPPPVTAPPRRNTWVATLVTIFGTLIILGTVANASLQAIRTSAFVPVNLTAEMQDVTGIDVDISAANLTIEFAEQRDATLEVTSADWRTNKDWRLEVRNDVLRVSDSRGFWFNFGWDWGSSREEAVLTLPSTLEGDLDADLQLAAGGMDVSGDLGAVSIDLSAGSINFVGASQSLDLDVSAGNATVATSDPHTVQIDLSAGRADVAVAGEAPTSTRVDVSAGRVDLRVPEGTYNATGEASAGQRTINVRTDPSSANLLEANVSAGRVEVSYSN